MKAVSVLSPAKVNLFLEVTGKRKDGYHNLATVFAKIDLCDRLTVRADKKDGPVTCRLINKSGCELKADGNNLAVRGARVFLSVFGLKNAVHITLTKRIPIGAGLGGGSSNAAAAMRALCIAFGKNPKDKKLLRAAAKLGADVPFFLYDETFCLGRGIGERLTPLACCGKLPRLVVAFPGVPVPTAQVYKDLRLGGPRELLTSQKSLRRLIILLKKGKPYSAWGQLLYNRLEQSVLPNNDRVAALQSQLRGEGCVFVLMSGSGSSSFALVGGAAEASRIARRVNATGRRVFSTRFHTTGVKNYENHGNPHSSDE